MRSSELDHILDPQNVLEMLKPLWVESVGDRMVRIEREHSLDTRNLWERVLYLLAA